MKLASLVIALALSLMLGVAATAHALSFTPERVGITSIAAFEGEEELDESEEDAEEEAEREEEEEEEEEEETSPPPECLLQTARAQAFAYPSQGKLRLLIRYTATAPTEAAIDYHLKGGKGSLKFAEAKQHLGQTGSIHLSENLSKSETSKAVAAKSFTVELHIPMAPHYCQRFYTRHLTIEHASASRLTWLQSDSIFGT
jgi:hypothetical protein